MKNEEYITISEFAKRAGVSHQALYKRLDKDLQPWLQVASGKKMLNIKALELFTVNQSCNQVYNNEMLSRMVKMLEKELDIKNQQIETLNHQVEELNARLKESHILIGRQQELQAIAEKKDDVISKDPDPIHPDPEPETIKSVLDDVGNEPVDSQMDALMNKSRWRRMWDDLRNIVCKREETE